MTGVPIKQYEKIVPDAYHGTDLASAENIVATRTFVPSNGEDDYLGEGIYFFEGSEWHARDWAKRKAKGKPVGTICAFINLGRCLDLSNKEHRDFLRKIALKLVTERRVPQVSDALVINFVTVTFKGRVDTVRAVYCNPNYREGAKIFPGSRFYDYSQLMICVKNPRCILDISMAYMGG